VSPHLLPHVQRRQTRPYQLAYLYFKNNEFTQAEHAARDYVASNSQCDRGYRLLGDILHALNKRDEALNAYQKSLELNPNQEDVLFNVCDLMPPDSADIERLEHWAERAAKSGFLDVADKFRRNIEAAKAAIFPENKKLNCVLQNIVRHERSPKPTERAPSSVNGTVDRITPLKLFNEADVSFTGLTSRTLPTPEKVLLQRQHETLLKNLKEDISKNLDSQQSKLSESTTGLMTAVKENRELILSVKATVDEMMKEIRQLRSTVHKIHEGQSKTADATAKLTEAFNNFNLHYTGGLEDYEDDNYEGYDEENENVYNSGVPETNQPLQLKNLPDFTQLQTAAQTPSIFSRIATIPQSQTQTVAATAPSTIPTASSTAPVLTSLLTPQSKPVSATPSTQPTFTFGVPSTFGNSFPSTATPSAPNVFDAGANTEFKFGQSSSFNFCFGQKPSESAISDDEGDEGDDSHDLEAEPDVHFKPVIELPPKVDAISGEEEEEELFKERCKVYRFTSGEWKERGTGDMKVLYNPARNKSRLLMRRDQVLKVVVNHLLTPDIEFKGFEKVPPYKCYTWSALNASDGPPVPEVLCVRFKTEEIATAFLEAAKKGKEIHLSKSEKSSSSADVQVVYVKEADTELAKKAEELKLPPNFYDYLKKEPCKGCPGCEDDSDQPNPSASSEKSASATPKSSPATTTSTTSVYSPLAPPKLNALSSNQTLTTTPKTTTTFGAAPVFGSSSTQGTFSFGLANATTTSTAAAPVFGSSFPSSTPVFGFGNQTDNSTTAKKDSQISVTTTTDSSSTSSIFSSPQNTTAFSWGLTSNTKTIFGNTNLSDTNGVADKIETTTFGFKFGGSTSSGGSTFDSGFAWGNDNNKSASWLNSTPAPIFGQSNGKEDDDDDGGDDGEEEEHDPQFAPIIPLPDEVEVKTGEEDEEVIYCQRAKLYRYDTAVKQWKERGVGDLKILKHKEKPRFRLIMRREQVHKVACNHYLTKEMNLKPFPNSETTLSWTAMDFSEEAQGEMQGFAVKFKTIDLKNAFQSKFEELQRQLS